MKKTTKIIGAVLGVLLVAALFVGAGAAAAPTAVNVTIAGPSTPIDDVLNDAGGTNQTLKVEFDAPGVPDTGATLTLKASEYLKYERNTTVAPAGVSVAIVDGDAVFTFGAGATAGVDYATLLKITAVKTTDYAAAGAADISAEYYYKNAATTTIIEGTSTNLVIIPKLEAPGAVLAGETFDLKITANAGESYKIFVNPAQFTVVGANPVTIGSDRTATVQLTTLTPLAAGIITLQEADGTALTTPATATVAVPAWVIECDKTLSATPVTMKAGETISFTLRGTPDNTAIVTLPATGVFGKVGAQTITEAGTVTFTAVQATIPAGAAVSYLPYKGAGAPTAGNVIVPITITTDAEVYGVGEEITLSIYGIDSAQYYFGNGITSLQYKDATGQFVDAATAVTPGAPEFKVAAGPVEGPLTVTLKGTEPVADLVLELSDAATAAAWNVVASTTISLVPDVTYYYLDEEEGWVEFAPLEGIDAGTQFKIKIENGGANKKYALPEFGSAFEIAPLQDMEYSVEIKPYAYTQAVFTTNAAGEAEIEFEAVDAGDDVIATLPLLAVTSVINPTGADYKYQGTLLQNLSIAINSVGGAPADIKTVYAYTDVAGKYDANKIWYLLDTHKTQTNTSIKTVAVDGEVYFDGLVEEGLYQQANGGQIIRVEFPKIVATATVTSAGTTYNLADSFVAKDIDGVSITLSAANPAIVGGWQLVDENGNGVKNLGDIDEIDVKKTLNTYKSGIYGLQPYFVDGYLVKTADEDLYFGEPIFFGIGKAAEAEISLSAEKVTVGETFVATIIGVPGYDYMIDVPEDIEIQSKRGFNPSATVGTFTMGAKGVYTVTLKAVNKNDEADVTLTGLTDDADESATIEIVDGVLTAAADKEFYTIGDKIKLEGTYSADDTKLYFFIEGINVGFRAIEKANGGYISTSGAEWEQKITIDDLQKTVGKSPDAGTYTVYVAPFTDVQLSKIGGITAVEKDDVTDGVYETVPVVLKQSFITLTSAPTVVAQGEKIEVVGTANAAKTVVWYLFGTNFFEAGVQKVKDDEFTIKVDGKYTEKKYMAAGQYFLVVQHPMYDEKYSIAPAGMDYWNSGDNSIVIGHEDGFDGSVLKSDQGGVYYSQTGGLSRFIDGTAIFNTDFRQRANAAQALCDALDSQNFDDMYAKASFIVGAPTSIINPIPAKATQGEKLTISGTTTGHKGDIVTVEFLSTAFAAVPKQAVGTAAFVTVNTKVQDDGTWAIEFDTSNLNADEYTVSVAVGTLDSSVAKITIVKGDAPVTPTTAPTGEPTTAPTTAPTQTPASPGFGILAALAGLGAVAVLLLRRQ